MNYAETAENNANSAVDTANAANATAGEAKAIAQGSQRAIGFATLQAAITALNGYSNTQLKVGDNVYIVETGVPDLWVAAVEQNSVAYNYTTNDAFNDDLSNWYVRLDRKRFWGKEMSEDKLSAYQTLYTCLMTVAKLLAPFAPFYADELYHDLGGELESVHLDKFPVADEATIDADLEERMAIAQKITSMVLALRRKVNIKVRQPLQQIMIPAVDDVQKAHIEAVAGLLKNEVNVKEVNFIEGQGILVKKVKCNFRVMGKKFGKLMKGVAAQMSALDQDQAIIL